MKQIIVLCLIFASLALAQRQRVAVMPSPSIPAESKITAAHLEDLEKNVRTIMTNKLPQTDFILLKQDEIQEGLSDDGKVDGDSAYAANCEAGTCLGALMKKVKADFGARNEVSFVNNQLYLRFELYGTYKGQSEAGEVGSFYEPVKNFEAMQVLIRKEVPRILDTLIKYSKTPEERCKAAKKHWTGNDCVDETEALMNELRADCDVKAENEKDKRWRWDPKDKVCKTMDQITCENKPGMKWVEDADPPCKSEKQIACENKRDGSEWLNGACAAPRVVTPVIAPAPIAIAPPTGGGGSGTFTAQVHTEPAGASLYVNGNLACNSTPCNISVYERSGVRITAAMSEHDNADTTLTLTTPGQVVNLKLKPKTYSVSFTSEPSGASLALEGYGKCETPCRMNLVKGRVKMTAGSDRFYDRKDTTVLITGISNQQINLKLNPNFGTLELKGAGGWDLRVDDVDYGNGLYETSTFSACQAGECLGSLSDERVVRLLPGTHKIRLTDSDYEDIEFSMDIRKNERKSFDISDKIVHRYGHLNINPSYSSGIGENENWYLQIDGESYSFGEVKLLHGEHQVKLTHRCYEDINLDAKIERNGNTSLDIQDKVSLKQGTLVLRAKRKVRNITMPVFVNGKQVGETPYEGSIPICSEVKMGKDGKESVPVKLEHNKPVEYTYKDGTYKSHWLGAMLNITGAVLIGSGIFMLNDRDNTYKEYSDLKPVSSPGYNNRAEYDMYWKDVESAHSEGNTYLILGGAIFALGIGVHVWF